jgi:hypothetical protein
VHPLTSRNREVSYQNSTRLVDSIMLSVGFAQICNAVHIWPETYRPKVRRPGGPRSAASSARCSRLIGSRTPTAAAAPISGSTRARPATRWPVPSISAGSARSATAALRTNSSAPPGSQTCWSRPSGGGLHGAAAPGRDDQRRPVAACRTARLGAHRADRRLRLEHCRSTAGRYAQSAAEAAISTGGLSSLNVPDVVHSEHFRVVTPNTANHRSPDDRGNPLSKFRRWLSRSRQGMG